jgi:hypothetical protein
MKLLLLSLSLVFSGTILAQSNDVGNELKGYSAATQLIKANMACNEAGNVDAAVVCGRAIAKLVTKALNENVDTTKLTNSLVDAGLVCSVESALAAYLSSMEDVTEYDLYMALGAIVECTDNAKTIIDAAVK